LLPVSPVRQSDLLPSAPRSEPRGILLQRDIWPVGRYLSSAGSFSWWSMESGPGLIRIEKIIGKWWKSLEEHGQFGGTKSVDHADTSTSLFSQQAVP
jgi:hypothetical protein